MLKNLPGIGPVKDGNGNLTSDKESVKERKAEHFENMPIHDKVRGNEIETNEKACKNLDSEGRFIFRGRVKNITKRIEKYSGKLQLNPL